MKKMGLIFNHTLTEDQLKDLLENNFTPVYMPEELKNIFKSINPEFAFEEVKKQVKPIIDWIKESDLDAILLQGEFTAFIILYKEFEKDLDIYVATTKRVVEEVKDRVKRIIKKVAVFKHVQFRKIN